MLEWCARGSLGDYLDDPEHMHLAWQDPLLKLATDTAKGMAYLHGRRWYDELSDSVQTTVIHRDLKPENVLLTDTFTAKVSDFGISRGMPEDPERALMSCVGTPLFAAPEVLRGEQYSEKCDVYSFGLLLLNMVINEPLLEYISEQFRLHKKRKKKMN